MFHKCVVDVRFVEAYIARAVEVKIKYCKILINASTVSQSNIIILARVWQSDVILER